MDSDELNKLPFSMKQVDLLIDSPGITEEETVEMCQSIVDLKPGSVWVKPCYVQAAILCLRHTDIAIGQPLAVKMVPIPHKLKWRKLSVP